MIKLITKPLKFKTERYAEATGKNWEEWVRELKKIGADEMPHKEIASLLVKQYKLTSWWAQSITVRFEQEIGRRIPGETCENTFQATVSKTVVGNAEEFFLKWTDRFSSCDSLNGIKLTQNPVTSITKKWHYWRVGLKDSSAISVNFSQKENDKALIQINHDKLLNREELFSWKNFWKKKLAEFLDSIS